MKKLFASIPAFLFLILAFASASSQAAVFTRIADIPDKFQDAYSLNQDHNNPSEITAASQAVAALYANSTSLGGDFFGPAVLTTPAMVQANEAALFAAFCNTDWQPTNVVIDHADRKIAIQYDLTAEFCDVLHLPTGDIPPNNRTATLHLSTFITVNHLGKIVEEYRHANLQAFFDFVFTP